MTKTPVSAPVKQATKAKGRTESRFFLDLSISRSIPYAMRHPAKSKNRDSLECTPKLRQQMRDKFH